MDINETRSWLDIVYSETPGLINVCATEAWTGRIFETSDTESALSYIQELDAEGREGIYLRATTLRSRPERGRGGDELSFMLPGLWADVDIAGPGHKSKETLPPNVEEAIRIVLESGLPEPSHWVHSGGGLYPWWLLRNPAEIDDVEDFRALSMGWQKVLEASAKKLGYHYGPEVGDLSRVLRIPGTTNRKEGLERPCTGLEGHSWSGRLFDVSELRQALIACTPEPEAPVVSRMEIKLAARSDRQGVQPGDDFNLRASWDELLLNAGWQLVRKTGSDWYWRRPGKLRGEHSATVSDITGNMFVYSTDARPLEAWKHYSKWAFLTVMEFGGDFKASAKALANAGYGTPLDTTNYGEVVLQSVTQTPVTNNVQAEVAVRDKEGFPVYSNDALRTQSWNQQGVSEIWADTFQGNFAYSPATRWRAWDKDVWVRDETNLSARSADLMVRRISQEAARVEAEDPQKGKNLVSAASRLNTSSSVDSILKIASRDPRIARSHKDFDADPSLITTGNGTLGVTDFQLMPHDPKYMLTRKINASYLPETPKGRWNQFMEEVLPNQEVREYLQRACGYMLTGTLSERAMFLIHGESGTGKTQFLEALYSVLGDFAGIAPASAFQPRLAGYKGPTEDLHKLMGKRFVIQSELDAGSKLNESLVKSITGGDTQTTRALYGEPVDWKPEYTVFLATNYLPRISSSDNAIWNRVKPIKFEQVFVNEYGEALDPSSRNLGKKMAEECADEILLWVLDGLKMYRQRGLDDPPQVRGWLNGYREDVDTVRQFLAEGPGEERIEVAEGKQVKVRELYKSFLAFCADNGITPLGSRSFTERMLSAGWKKEKREKGIMWQGIGLCGFILESQTPSRKWQT